MRGLDPAPLKLRLHAGPEFAALLRERIRMWLEEAGAAEREIFEVLLAATEAFANAVQHPQEPKSDDVDVEAAITDHTLTISIRDYGSWQMEQARNDNGGRGLGMIEELMDAVRVECFADGTKVTMGRRLAMHS